MRTRVLLPALAACLTLTLAVGSALAGDAKGALKFVPGDSMAVVGFDADDLRKSSLFGTLRDEFISAFGITRDIKMLKTETGLDIKDGIRSLVIFGPSAWYMDEEQFGLVMEAPHDPARLKAYLEKSGGTLEARTHAAGEYFVLGKKAKGAIAFQGDYIIVGPKNIVSQALDAKSGKSALDSGKLGRLAKKAKAGKSAFGALLATPQIQRWLTRQANLTGAKGFWGTMDVSSGLKIDGAGNFATAENAAAAAAAINKNLTDIKNDKETAELGFGGLFDKMSAKADGTKLSLKLDFSKDDVNKVVNTLKEFLE